MNIIPGILATSFKDLKKKLDTVSWAKKIHIDITDGKFVKNKTIQIQTLRKALLRIKTPKIQIHLMAKRPETYIDGFSKIGANEFIFHVESTNKIAETINKIKKTNMKTGIAFNPRTQIGQHKEAIKQANIGLVMTINPGKSGQKFMQKPLKKIKQIKNLNKKIKIGVDGGCNLQTCQLIKKANADFAIATSAVTNTKNPKKSYQELKKCQ